MKHLKRLLSALISCATISSCAAFTASVAADNTEIDIYDNSTNCSESKEDDSQSVPTQVWRVGKPGEISVQTETQTENETPFNVFDIYDAHQNYVKLKSGDKSMMYKKSEGIDVSYAQGKIDWKTVKASGIDYAIIRAGYGNANDYPWQVDNWFKYNIEEAQKVGIDVGVYWYSYAFDVDAARKEAESCCNVIKSYDLQYPVYFDIEEEKHKQMSDYEVSAIVDTFCTTMQSNGYRTGVYSFASLLSSKIYQQVLDKYDIWVAHWNVNSPSYNKDYGMWQYTDRGSVPGIEGPVDRDHCYINFPYLISPETYIPDGSERSASVPLYPANVNKGMAGGIDVSVWQGKIDWSKVKSSGKSYAIIRAGYGNLATQRDKYFEANVKGAQAAGIDCGAYWYSYAESPEDAVLEAEACYEVIKGYKFQYPVYYAIEDTCFSSMSSQEITAIVNAFCSTLEKKGYYVGIKSYANFLNTRLDASIYSKYDVWVSHYGVTKPDFSKNYNMWQYSNEEKVNGINGYVNSDYAYLNFPKIMKDNHLNGF
ncbi:MAG: glycoside hydrolase family 25 protein [Ruminococcus sp.]|uniref:glycoside hydrolase family 25 protein n=1 Tax=Ruminococcus sp. TaxID=41978 RepID=UPI0025CD12BC|nr:glycoside hydrolase family 25 protein [Ruminococcus sp.]MCR5601092.1 glycoside hydrolase family 25 protein [Ruminococcus sp.]